MIYEAQKGSKDIINISPCDISGSALILWSARCGTLVNAQETQKRRIVAIKLLFLFSLRTKSTLIASYIYGSSSSIFLFNAMSASYAIFMANMKLR